jgi:hypothetical protein
MVLGYSPRSFGNFSEHLGGNGTTIVYHHAQQQGTVVRLLPSGIPLATDDAGEDWRRLELAGAKLHLSLPCHYRIRVSRAERRSLAAAVAAPQGVKPPRSLRRARLAIFFRPVRSERRRSWRVGSGGEREDESGRRGGQGWTLEMDQGYTEVGYRG